MDDLKTIFERIRKPLAFAARDDFTHVKSLTGLESFIHAQVKELKQVSGHHDGLAQLEKVFSGFDGLTPDKKRERILTAMELIAAFEHSRRGLPEKTTAPAAATGAPAPLQTANVRLDTPIQYCKGIGPKRAELLKKLGIAIVEDALTYLPGAMRTGGTSKNFAPLLRRL